MDANDELIRVYSRILGIRAHLSEGLERSEVGKEYDSLVDRATAALSKDLDEFKIGKDHLTPDGKYHLADQLAGRIDALMSYLRVFIPRETVERIGFPVA